MTRRTHGLTAAAALGCALVAALPGQARADTPRHESANCSGVCAVPDARPRRLRAVDRKQPLRHAVASRARILVPESSVPVTGRYVSLLILGVAY
jgi:hypothetical protein